MSNPILTVIKGLSIALISTFLILESWNLSTPTPLPDRLHLALLMGHFVLTVHSIEAIVASIYGRTQGKHPIRYALYSFFVGFPSLLELWQSPHQQPES